MDKQQIIDSLFDEIQLKQDIATVLGSFDPMRWSLDANMEDAFDAHMAAKKPYDQFYINEEGYIYQSCWNCATNDEKIKYAAMRDLANSYNYKTALDYGCAIGTGLVMLALEGIDSFGVEICKPSIEFVEYRKKKYNLPNIQVLQPNSIKLREGFDLIICTEVLEHVDNPIELAWKLADMTKPGGRLILSWSFVDMTAHVPENFYLNTPHPDQLETAGFGKLLKEDIGLKLDRSYGGGSGYLWFNNCVWMK